MGNSGAGQEDRAEAGREEVDRWRLAYYRAIAWGQFQGGFLARTAHELRSPLSQTISLHQMVLENLCDDVSEEHQCVQQANAAALKLLEHLDFLIRLSKLETGATLPHCQALPLAPIFRTLQELTQLQAQNRSLRLEIIPPAPDVMVWADGDWLLQVLVLLIEGAIAASPRGPIHLEVAPNQDEVAQNEANHHILWLWDHRPADSWQEPIPLSGTAPVADIQPLPLGLRHSLALALAQAMDGEIHLMDPPLPFSHGLQYYLPRPGGRGK